MWCPGGPPPTLIGMRILTWVLAAYLALVLLVTLWPSPESTAAPGWAQAVIDMANTVGIPLTIPVAEALANVAMFFPLGALATGVLARRRRVGSWRRSAAVVTIAGAGLSAVIETAQLAIPGRVSTVQDVFLNTVGGAGGAFVVAAAVLCRSRRRARGGSRR